MTEPLSKPDQIIARTLEVERAVLGGILIDNERFHDAREHVSAADFFRAAHHAIFATITRLIENGRPVDLLILTQELTAEELEAAGGPSYVAGLIDGVPYGMNVGYYAREVAEKSSLRTLSAAARRILHAAENADDEATVILTEAERSIAGIRDRHTRVDVASPTDRSSATYKQLETIMAAGGALRGVPTGLAELDQDLRGLHPGNLVIVAARPSMGKAQPLDAHVLTADGWKRMGDLRVGDAVVSPTGPKPERVTAIYPQGEKVIFRVRFIDGRSVECCEDHLWRVHSSKWADGKPRVISTKQISALLQKTRYRSRISVDLLTGDFGSTTPLPLDPWLLGVLLGDGCFRRGARVAVSSADEEILSGIQAAAPRFDLIQEAGCNYLLINKGQARTATRRKAAPHAVRDALRRLGLWSLLSEQKFIPAQYLDADRASRIALLRGLLDTDGWVESFGSVRFSTTSERLAYDVQRLAHSIGAVCAVKPRAPGRYRHLGEARIGLPSFVCTISYRNPKELFTLTRKRRRVTVNRRRRRLTITGVEVSRKAEAQCIAVTHPEGLYVTDGYVVTHNTALAQKFAISAGRPDSPVLVFSLEMSADELNLREVTTRATVDSWRLLHGQTTAWEQRRLMTAIEEMQTGGVYVADQASITVGQISAISRRKQREGGLALVIVDYLQLITPEQPRAGKRTENRTTEVGEMSRSLKVLARELRVPVVLLSQLSRGPESRPDKRPQMADLRESGSIEQDADVVLLLYRPNAYKEIRDKNLYKDHYVEIHIAKQRNGPTGIVQSAFYRECTKFDNYTDEPQPLTRQDSLASADADLPLEEPVS
jgi:replicative DNA helicase